jgi:hypothetical protein
MKLKKLRPGTRATVVVAGLLGNVIKSLLSVRGHNAGSGRSHASRRRWSVIIVRRVVHSNRLTAGERQYGVADWLAQQLSSSAERPQRTQRH